MAARYVTIAEDLQARIAEGQWEVGAFLASEPELASKYGVSRETLRAALRQLEDAGLIARRKGQGTRVVRLQPVQEFHTKLSSIEELAQYGRTAERTILSVEEVAVDGPLADELGLPEGTVRTVITSTRRDPAEGGRPASWAKVYISPADAPLIQGELKDSDRLVADLIAERTGRQVIRVLQQIKATVLDEEAAKALGEIPGSVALRLTRRYIDADGGILAVAISTHPATRFVYESVLERG